jgi:hypothetical protein
MQELISLGWFKWYCLEVFFDQSGKPGTIPVKKYGSLCATIGQQLARHCNCNVPCTNFQKGFSSGANLMGHTFTGCLLDKLFAIHTTQFSRIFPKRKEQRHPQLQVLRRPNHITDWKSVVLLLVMILVCTVR